MKGKEKYNGLEKGENWNMRSKKKADECEMRTKYKG